MKIINIFLFTLISCSTVKKVRITEQSYILEYDYFKKGMIDSQNDFWYFETKINENNNITENISVFYKINTSNVVSLKECCKVKSFIINNNSNIEINKLPFYSCTLTSLDKKKIRKFKFKNHLLKLFKVNMKYCICDEKANLIIAPYSLIFSKISKD